jgi:type I restriction enzyme S subunit
MKETMKNNNIGIVDNGELTMDSGSGKTINSKVPQLRFPEFEGKWEEKKLEHIGEYFGGGTPDTSIEEYWKGDIPWISSSDIYESSIHKIYKTRFITKKAIEKSATKLIPKGSILMVSRVGIGKFAIADEDLCTSQDFTNIVTKENEYFLGYCFKSKSNRFISLSQGTSIKGFTTNDIKSAKFRIPALKEQTRIANFLTAVDRRIELLQKKRDGLESYKKGLMQKLFNGEWIVEDGKRKFVPPTIRFKPNSTDSEQGRVDNGEIIEDSEKLKVDSSQSAFTSYPDWEEKKLGDLGVTYNGLTGKTKFDFGKGKPYIQYMQIFSDSKIDTTIFGLVNVEEGENQNSAQYGDVFFTTSSETPNEIGTSSVLTEHVGETYLNSFCFGYRPNSLNELVPEFSQFFFRSNKVRKEIIKLAQGSTRFNMSKVELMKLKFVIPIKEEQQKIATFLSSVDKKIEKTEQQIEESKQWKKGLLQKMFV